MRIVGIHTPDPNPTKNDSKPTQFIKIQLHPEHKSSCFALKLHDTLQEAVDEKPPNALGYYPTYLIFEVQK